MGRGWSRQNQSQPNPIRRVDKPPCITVSPNLHDSLNLTLISGLRDSRYSDIGAAGRLVEPGGQHQPRRPAHGQPAGGRPHHEPEGGDDEAEAEEGEAKERGQEAETEGAGAESRQEEE